MSDRSSVTDDAFWGQRILLRQPKKSYRAGIDPVFLAACVPAEAGTILDLGCGVGAAILCAVGRLPQARGVGIERDEGLVALARHNAATNGWADRLSIHQGDVTQTLPVLDKARFDAVIFNPPFYDVASGSPSPRSQKAAAHHAAADDLAAWVATGFSHVADDGVVCVILHADQWASFAQGLAGWAGPVTIYPLFPHDGEAAIRLLIRAQTRKAGRPHTRLLQGMVLHGPDGRYSAAAEAILRGGEALSTLAGHSIRKQ